MGFERIAVATDFSEPAAGAVELAGHLAVALGAELFLFHVHDPTAGGSLGGEVVEERRREAEERVAAAERDLRGAHPGLPVAVELVVDDDVVGALCELAESASLDLLVVSSLGRTGLQRFLLGSVAERVVRRAPCPVWVERGDHHRVPERLQVCSDLSVASEEGLHLAGALARALGCHVELLHVEPEGPGALSLETRRDLQAQRTERLEAVRHSHLGGREARLTVLPGPSPVEAITTHAERTSPHVLVLATHGRRGVTRFLLGSVAERVARHASCAVLVARRSTD